MKVELKCVNSIQGYGKMSDVHHSRIKAISIKPSRGNNPCEFRLVKESKGYIFRDTLADIGINGHHKNIKKIIASSLGFVTIHVDETFSCSEQQRFKELEQQHRMREQGRCKHYANEGYHRCPKCGLMVGE